MIPSDLISQRLYNQRISYSDFKKPEEVVKHLGAVQAQDYAGAKWAIGQRTVNGTDELVEKAYNEGKILRTHVMRPTWHFVAFPDIRWMLKLTAPRVHAICAYYYRKSGLDNAIFQKSHEILTKELQGNHQKTREELVLKLKEAGIETDSLGYLYIILQSELDAIICSGARRGKQCTYALLEERAPNSKMLEHDEALAELTKRYVTGHGPATVQDFSWWSGLTLSDARRGLEMLKNVLEHEVINGKTYWFSDSQPYAEKHTSTTTYLLPNYDEYIVGYADRSAIFDSTHMPKLDLRANPLFQHTIVMNGKIVGTWKQIHKNKSVILEPHFFELVTPEQHESLVKATENYKNFLGIDLLEIKK